MVKAYPAGCDVASLYRGSDPENLFVDGGAQIIGQRVRLLESGSTTLRKLKPCTDTVLLTVSQALVRGTAAFPASRRTRAPRLTQASCKKDRYPKNFSGHCGVTTKFMSNALPATFANKSNKATGSKSQVVAKCNAAKPFGSVQEVRRIHALKPLAPPEREAADCPGRALPSEINRLLRSLPDRERTLVLLAAGTGLRMSELFGLKWQDIDFAGRQLNVLRSIVKQAIGPCRTEASQKPVPLDPRLVRTLRAWHGAVRFPQALD